MFTIVSPELGDDTPQFNTHKEAVQWAVDHLDNPLNMHIMKLTKESIVKPQNKRATTPLYSNPLR